MYCSGGAATFGPTWLKCGCLMQVRATYSLSVRYRCFKLQTFSAIPTESPMAHVSTLEGKDNAPSRNSHDTDANADTMWKAETAPNQKQGRCSLDATTKPKQLRCINPQGRNSLATMSPQSQPCRFRVCSLARVPCPCPWALPCAWALSSEPSAAASRARLSAFAP